MNRDIKQVCIKCFELDIPNDNEENHFEGGLISKSVEDDTELELRDGDRGVCKKDKINNHYDNYGYECNNTSQHTKTTDFEMRWRECNEKRKNYRVLFMTKINRPSHSHYMYYLRRHLSIHNASFSPLQTVPGVFIKNKLKNI